VSGGPLGDLARLLAALPPDQHALAAGLIGFARAEARVREADPPSDPSTAAAPIIMEASAAPDAARDGITARFWRVDEVEHHGPSARDDAPAPPPPLPDGAGRSLLHRPRCPPITDWSYLEPRLRSALTGRAHGQALDVPAVVYALGRGRVLTRLPRREWAAWPARLAVWLDRSERLVTVIEDQVDVLRRLVGACGYAALAGRLRVLDPAEQASAARTFGHLDVGEDAPVVLAMTDLGACGSAWDRRLWLATGEAVRQRGAAPVALCPVGVDRVPEALRRVWIVVPWQEHAVPASAERTDALLTRACAAALLQPSLLRRIRLELPDADVGTELDALGHDDVVSVDAGAIVLAPERRVARLAALLGPGGPAGVEVISDLVREWHAELPEELAHAEVWSWRLTGSTVRPPGDARAAEAFAAALLAQLSGAGAEDWRHFAWQALAAAPAFGDDALGRTLAELWARARPERYAGPVPAGVDPAAARRRSSAWWGLRQVGDQLVLEPQPAVPDPAVEPLRPGSPVTRVRASFCWAGPREIQVRDGASVPLPTAGDLVLRTDDASLRLRSDVPAWATAAGRDRYGVWAEATLYGVRHRFRWIPPGRFWMGSPETEVGRWEAEGPRHEVVLTRGLWLGETPVTQALWTASGRENPSHFRGDELPVERVSWHDARQFLDGLPGPNDGMVWRLPTEAEWERACRAGTDGATWRGEVADAAVVDPIAWHPGNSKGNIRPVATRDANPWGLHDLLGSVWEWCEDAWRDSYGSDARVIDPLFGGAGRTAADRVIRGGSWLSTARLCRAACRFRFEPSRRWVDLGFRLARGCLAPAGGQAGRDARGAVKAGDRPKQATTRPSPRREED
jgi:formylglycine-generating enzyme required for sulfatase activity